MTMDQLREMSRRLRALFTQSEIARGLDDEMRTHVALREEQLRAAGSSADEAARAARGRFGNMGRLRDEGIDAWGWRWLEQLTQDVRFGVRMLVKSPAVTVVAIATLALATGATTAIFSVLNGVVLRPLPFDEPERLVQVYGRNWAEDRGGTPDPVTGPVHPRDLEAFVRTSKSFDGFSAYSVTTLHVETASGTERLNAVSADANLFSVLGVQAVLGRTFGPDDPENVAVVSRRLWRERFAEDPSLPGRTLTLNGQVFTVTGCDAGARSSSRIAPHRCCRERSASPAPTCGCRVRRCGAPSLVSSAAGVRPLSPGLRPV